MARFQRNTAFYCLLGVLFNVETVSGGYVYFHHYVAYANAYQTCKHNSMRLVRVDNEAKHQELMDFTKGVENFTVGSASFYISLKYDVSSSAYLWPDGSGNTLTDKWQSSDPSSSDINQCVTQFGGQHRNYGQWRTRDCEKGSPFICESGQPDDPDLTTSSNNVLWYRTFLKVNTTLLNVYNQSNTRLVGILCPVFAVYSQAKDSSYFKFEDSDFVIYKGHKEEDDIVCAVGCMSDRVCTGVMYTHNSSPHAAGNMCILLRERQP